MRQFVPHSFFCIYCMLPPIGKRINYNLQFVSDGSIHPSLEHDLQSVKSHSQQGAGYGKP